ncbi:monofunctional biosynthetic peptidoglycan transglycosylase [Parapedobacter koreensis]|uniref:Biosynthetic peptidoglycan transglycosylase n=1 Tax=Parapedobacter koreensis TaxID=332977 RepID=A0A1H7SAB5_9SPHI|nr:monofunctional biosynthetic peptidoglycan transglycosylase [Parapedobacter koreensis]SEL68487.1 monofunctional biosynthetic peptidoglycan transglycosylase [Parapedobacter koreensis]
MAAKRKRRKLTKSIVRFIPVIRNVYLRWTLRIVAYFFAVTLGWVLLLCFINPPITWLMVQRGFERKSDGKAWKITKQWVSYEDLSDNLKRAAISGEDARFMEHWGFDRKAIADAFRRNQGGGALRGGSTISQQTAKNVFLWPGRSWIRKGFETYFTVLIELFWSKKRILEVYLNVIETGDGLYGAEAATQYYYGKSASNLTKRQAALLIAVLPNPRRWSPAKPTAFINRKTNVIVRYMGYSDIP